MSQTLKHFLRKIKQSFDRDPSKIALHPSRDWGIILTIFFLAVAGISLYSYSTFLNAYHGEYLGEEGFFVRNHEYDRFQTDLSQTLEYYGEKENMFETLRSEPKVFVDPSYKVEVVEEEQDIDIEDIRAQ